MGERLAGVAGWASRIAADRLPPHLVLDRDSRQYWVVDTTRLRRT